MPDDISISIADHLSQGDLQRIEALLPQLSRTAGFDSERMLALIDSPSTDLFLARGSGRILGMATLAAVPLVSGWHATVEDVVVDEDARGRGIARLLLEAIIDETTRRGIPTLDLTSRPSRESALRLYESVGFVRRNTNVLRLSPRSD